MSGQGSNPEHCTRLRELHAGGMARLTLALTPEQTHVVIRELLPWNLLRPRLHRAFVQGTRIRALLTPHDHIVLSHGHGRRGLVPYEVIEFIEGESLRRLLQRRDPCLASHCLDLLRQAARALAHVHQKGFVHLDVKPENFLVTQSPGGPRVKLTDFDLSRPYTPRRVRHLSGTPAYLAPEQIRNGLVGPAADVFAFGIIAYELLTGHAPFHGKHERQQRWRQISPRFIPKAPRSLNPDLDPRIDAAIRRCLEKDPARRYASMTLLCEDF